MNRTLVIGDIHGGLRALHQIMERAKVNTTDTLIFLGDYVDGWSQSPQVIDYLIDITGTPSHYYNYLPFGEEMVAQNNSSYNNVYRFSAKELDEDTGLSYFGARYYDPKFSIWLSVDPLAEDYPNIGGYTYCANNPINIIDPDGRFLIDVHHRITENAFNNSKNGRTHYYTSRGTTTTLSQDVYDFRRNIVGCGANYEGSVVAPDIRSLPNYLGGMGLKSVDSNHFDNMNYSQIKSNFANINNGINSALAEYGSGNVSAKYLGSVIGEYYHAIEDFYSHSNYIELYEATYGQTSVSKIPTYEEAISSFKYKDFTSKFEKQLITGTYPGSGAGSHEDMNHDLGAGSEYWYTPEVIGKSVNWNSRAAEAVATKAITQYNNKVESKITR